MQFAFETVDVFTDRQFGGNPLAVFHDARGLDDAAMQALAREFNLSETTFVRPPRDPANTARVRIFNRTAEMPFAGHPSIGTAYVLGRAGVGNGRSLRLEVPAGVVAVELERDAGGAVVGGTFDAPQPLSTGPDIPLETIAACLGIDPSAVLTAAHRPIVASVGNPFVIAQVAEDALVACVPDLREFRRAAARHPELNGRFPVHAYAGAGELLRARMFSPISGTVEDPATGSANAPLGALLLSLGDAAEARFTVRQGVEMGRPSTLLVTARRRGLSRFVWCRHAARGSMRARRSSVPAWPYMERFSAFSLLICPSVWPLLQSSRTALRTASMSRPSTWAKRRRAGSPDCRTSVSQVSSFAMSLLRRTPLNRMANCRMVAKPGRCCFSRSTLLA